MLLNKKKETRVKFNPRLSANRPSNNWALKAEHGIGMTTHWGHLFRWYFIWSRAQFCIFIGVPCLRKSTHPRKFDNQVIPHRPPRNQVDEEPLCGCATSKSLFIYLFIFYLKCDRHPSKLVKINHQPSKLQKAIETLCSERHFGRGMMPRHAFKPRPCLRQKKNFHFTTLLKKRYLILWPYFVTK